MNILVTGSRGYIGKNLCKYLIDRGHNVSQIDRNIEVDVDNLGNDNWNPNEIQQHNFKDKYNHIEGIVHLAARAGIQDCQDYPMTAIEDNIQASNIIIDLAKELKVPMVFASSQAAVHPQSSVYAVTKAVTEQEMNRRILWKSKILRFANVYGGIGMLEDKTTVIANFMRAYLEDEPLIVHGDGSQTRDFIHVNDICQAILLALKFTFGSRTYDVGTGVETSVLTIAQQFGSEISYESSRSVGVKSNVANIEQIQKDTGFKPTVKVGDFIDDFIYSRLDISETS